MINKANISLLQQQEASREIQAHLQDPDMLVVAVHEDKATVTKLALLLETVLDVPHDRIGILNIKTDITGYCYMTKTEYTKLKQLEEISDAGDEDQ